MSSSARLTRGARIYVGCVILAGGAAITQACFDLSRNPPDWQWFILAGLTLLSGSITVKVPSVPATISVSETFVFTAVMLFGPAAGTVTVALDCLIISLWLQRKKREAFKAFFNVAAPSLSLWASAHLYSMLSGSVRLANAPQVGVSDLLAPLIIFTLAYFLLNSSLIAIAISLEKGTPATKVWRENFFWLSLNFFSGASLAALFVSYTRSIAPSAVAIIIPLLIISYLTYKTSMGRLEDATRHLGELNLLYLSTIETLAMWIDAKDQITHGHIRRVQTCAVELAKQLGVRDEKLVKAIEAAALLHDMGKLAVPEHILNKPGKLTPGEFEKMKLHASVGAQILSSIDFPYPVVPIVRHHHENWDGTGYPDGLSGTDIPIGARILAVVDCFDALTSDRPYRPRLGDDEALKMLSLRRGTMYDPLVVDAFLRVHPTVQPNLAASGGSVPDAEAVWNTVRQASIEDATGKPGTGPALPTVSIDVRGEIGRKLLQLARHTVPVSVGIVFAHDPDSDVLTVAHANGDGADRVGALRIRVGQGVSGWVAANKRTIANADSLLDLGEGFRSDGDVLRSCLSLPILLGDSLVGVLTLYSTEADRFSQADKDLLESQVSLFVNDLGSRANILDDETSALDEDGSMHGVFMHGQLYGQRVAIILLKVQIVDHLSEAERQSVASTVDRLIRDSVRGADLTIRMCDDESLIVLPQADTHSARSTGDRIAANVEGSLSRQGRRLLVVYGLAISPDHGSSFDALIQSARLHLGHPASISVRLSPAVH